jgi:hypothetical protein
MYKLSKVFGLVVQLVRMPPCHGGGRGFESRPVRKSPTEMWGFLLFSMADCLLMGKQMVISYC